MDGKEIDILKNTVQRISLGDYSVEIQVPIEETELTDLFVAHKIMLAEIKRTDRDRQDAYDSAIVISLILKDGDVEFSIKDNGIGIPKDEQGKIFEKFYRAQNAKQAVGEGTGLGLALAKTFVDAWGGKIWFESEENKGTTFHVTLPVLGKKESSRNVIL